MRSSRQTELAEKHPAHVVCAWMGNSPDVAKDHYLQVLDSHFERAIETSLETSLKAAHPAAEWGGSEVTLAEGSNQENPDFTGDSTLYRAI